MLKFFRNLETRRAEAALKAVDQAKANLDSCKADLSEAKALADTRGTHWERHAPKYKASGIMLLCTLIGVGTGYTAKGKLATTGSKK